MKTNRCEFCNNEISNRSHPKIFSKVPIQVLGSALVLKKKNFQQFLFCKVSGFFFKRKNKKYLTNLKKIFKKNYKIDNSKYGKNLKIKVHTMKRIENFLKRKINKKKYRILEYGCGNGDLIKCFNKDKYTFDIIEKNNFAQLKNIPNILNYYRDINETKKRYDLIICDNSIVQSTKISSEIKQFKNKIYSNGSVYIENKNIFKNLFYLSIYDIPLLGTIKSFIIFLNKFGFYSPKYGTVNKFNTEYAFFFLSNKKNKLRVNNKKLLKKLFFFERKILSKIKKINKLKIVNFLGAGIGCALFLNFTKNMKVQIYDNNKILENSIFNGKKIIFTKSKNIKNLIKTF